MSNIQVTITFTLIFLICSLNAEESENSRNGSREDMCLLALPENYDRHTPPYSQGKPVNVFIQIEVLNLDEVDEATMDFRLHAFVRAVWDDPRLLPNRLAMHHDCVKYIWTPDLIFEQTKAFIDIGQHTIFFHAKEDHLYLSQRYSFKVPCMMNFERYPFDTQDCPFSIAFMASDDSKAIPRWFHEEGSPYRGMADPIVFNKQIAPLQFHIMAPTTHFLVKKFMFTNFTYIWVNIPLARRLTGSLVNYYMPSTLLVVISWITFWLQEDAASERVTLIMTALLTICTQAEQYKSELPPVNYITALDIWFFVCMFMLIATLAEFAFSYNSYRKRKKYLEAQSKLLHETGVKLYDFQQSRIEEMERSKEIQNKPGVIPMLQLDDTSKLDSISKILFPSFFVIFSIIYWSYYFSV